MIQQLVNDEDFFNPRYRAIYRAVVSLASRMLVVDELTVENELRQSNMLEAVGGLSGISATTISIPTVDNAAEYARIVHQDGQKRRLRVSLSEALELVTSGDADEARAKMRDAGQAFDADTSSSARNISDMVKKRVEQFDDTIARRAAGEVVAVGIPTGIRAYDETFGQIPLGVVTCIGARNAMGKSVLGMTLAHACALAGMGVHVFSLEDTEDIYTDRYLSRTSGVRLEDLRRIDLPPKRYSQVADSIRQSNLATLRDRWLYHSIGGLMASQMVGLAKADERRNNTKMILIDYLQLVRAEADDRRMLKTYQVAGTMNVFAEAAKNHGWAVVVNCQLSREIDKRPDPTPMPADFSDSGSIDNTARLMLGLMRPAFYSDQPRRGVDYAHGALAPTEEEWRRWMYIYMLKNSHGKPGDKVIAQFDGPTTNLW